VWGFFQKHAPAQGFHDLAAGRSVTFNEVSAVQLDTRLPNLPCPSDVMRTHAIDLVSKLLVYPPESRLSAQDTLSHPFLTCDEVPLLLPPGYPLRGGQEGRQVQVEWEGLSLSDLVKALDNEHGSENDDNEIDV
jgi:serine/threonine protein kinase